MNTEISEGRTSTISRKPRQARGARGAHGLTRGRKIPALYRTWSNIKVRCYLETHKDYPAYGGRGITVCDRWLDGESGLSGFECFITDMGQRPTPAHSLERRNNDEGYHPGNCRWATSRDQARNNRHNRRVTIDGVEMLIGDAIERFAKVCMTQVYKRMRQGWSAEKAILTPPSRNRSR